MTTLSLPQIGRQFDRDHTTILSTRRKISAMRERDQKFDEELSQLEAQLLAMVQP
jgi:chromosomal replication initiator protein